MAYKDIAVRARDRKRSRRRSAGRVAQGKCPRCGERAPEPERSLCKICAAKKNAASRAHAARLRAAGKPRRDREAARAAERLARGLCKRCGKLPAVPERTSCKPCLEKGREADRARYARGKAAGMKYGGANIDAKRKSARAKSRRRRKARLEAGLCVRCGKRPPVEGGTTCAPCRDRRQAAERQHYAERRDAGLCIRCGGPVFDGLSRCGPCAAIEEASRPPERKNEHSRKRYAARRAAGLCTNCGAPSQGAARCTPCAERSYHGSDHFRGVPVWDPAWTVIELATGREHGPFHSEADVSLCLAFAKLSRDQVESVKDASPMASCASWV